MKNISVIRLARVNVSVVIIDDDAKAGHVVVRDNQTDEIKSAVLIYDNKPLIEFAKDNLLNRTLYIQSYNTENDLTSEERHQIRELIRAGHHGAAWLLDGRYDVIENTNGVESGVALLHENGELVQIDISMRCEEIATDMTLVIDLRNGPVNFNAKAMNDEHFINSVVAITQHLATC